MTKFSKSHSGSSQPSADVHQAERELREGEPCSISKINRFPEKIKHEIYSWLIPPGLFSKFHIDPKTRCNEDGESVFSCRCKAKTSNVRLELRHKSDFPDALFLLEMRDTVYGDVEIVFLNINDPYAERFHIDRDSAGHDTAFATVSRNIEEEIRAMWAGLAPGQVRRGLRQFRSFRIQATLFCQRLGIRRVKVEPLAYHNAIMHEFYGFRYMTGRGMMECIDREFAPGGVLFKRLDRSTPFRQPGFERSIRGRSWAIHDGILDEPWKSPRMYYSIDEPEGRVYDEFTCRLLSHSYPFLP